MTGASLLEHRQQNTWDSWELSWKFPIHFFEENNSSISSCKFPTHMWQHSSHLLLRQETLIKNLKSRVSSSLYLISCYLHWQRLAVYFVQVTPGEIHWPLPWPSHCYRFRAACPDQPACLPTWWLPCKAQGVKLWCWFWMGIQTHFTSRFSPIIRAFSTAHSCCTHLECLGWELGTSQTSAQWSPWISEVASSSAVWIRLDTASKNKHGF